MKYIYADKLIAEIERLKEETCIGICEYDKGEENGRFEVLNHLLSTITSLQQEQPKPSGYDKALLEVKSRVDELYEAVGIGLCEYDSGLYNGIAETCMKLRGFIKARLASDEQPEVDLEKEYKTWWNSITGKINIEHMMEWYMHETARHFYELGRKARNNEQ